MQWLGGKQYNKLFKSIIGSIMKRVALWWDILCRIMEKAYCQEGINYYFKQN